jgi:hypothetical protein
VSCGAGRSAESQLARWLTPRPSCGFDHERHAGPFEPARMQREEDSLASRILITNFLVEIRYETSPSTISAPGSRRNCTPGRVAERGNASLSVPPHHNDRAVPGGQRGRCNRAGSCRANEKLAWTAHHYIIIENVSGADGSIGTGRVARARPDGLELGSTSSHMMNGAVYSLAYDVANDFAPISPLIPVPDFPTGRWWLSPVLPSRLGPGATSVPRLQSTHCKYSLNTRSNLFRQSADEASTLPLNSWPCSDMKSTMNKAT